MIHFGALLLLPEVFQSCFARHSTEAGVSSAFLPFWSDVSENLVLNSSIIRLCFVLSKTREAF